MVSRFWTGDWRVSQPFGKTSFAAFHDGLDIAMPTGTQLFAGADCTVRALLDNNSVGALGPSKYVFCVYADGTADILGHLSAYGKTGTVKRGEQIGLSGATGNVTGAHLHFTHRTRVSDVSSAVDPTKYLTEGGEEMVTQQDLDLLWRAVYHQPAPTGTGYVGQTFEQVLRDFLAQPMYRDIDAKLSLDVQATVNAAVNEAIAAVTPRIEALEAKNADLAKQLADAATEAEKTRQELQAAKNEIDRLRSAADLSKANAIDLIRELLTRLFPQKGGESS